MHQLIRHYFLLSVFSLSHPVAHAVSGCQPITSEQMRLSLVDLIQQQLPRELQAHTEIHIHALQPAPDSSIVAIPQLTQPDLQSRIAVDFLTAPCQLLSNHAITKTSRLTRWYHLKLISTAWVYTQALKRHTSISPQHIQAQPIDVFLNRLRPEQLATQPLNAWVGQSVKSGDVVLQHHLMDPFLVKAHDTVTVYLYERGLRIRTSAKARSSGYFQDDVLIELSNPTRTLKGRVISTGVVQVEF